MSAYFIGAITKILDAEAFAEYASKTGATFPPFGGELLLRGKNAQDIVGENNQLATVVVRFPDMDAIHAWHDSDAYQALVPLRKKAIELTITAYQAP